MQVPGVDPDSADFVYDEFAYLHENCAEYGLAPPDDVQVERISQQLPDGRSLSALRWGSGPPRVVLLHGGAQNAHTWDTVAMALRPNDILAIDLPGHGHSGWRKDGGYGSRENADDVARMIERHAPDALLLVGMSLGGLTANAIAARHHHLVRRLLIVDITPGVTRDKAADVHAFIEGPQTFESFGELFERTTAFNPTRSASSLRRGILHNAHRLPSGAWEWNYDRTRLQPEGEAETGGEAARGDLWSDVQRISVPYLLVRGSLSPVVDDDDVAELCRLRPDARVVVVDGAGHSIQGDRPLELAALIRAELESAER
jgi:esterase